MKYKVGDKLKLKLDPNFNDLTKKIINSVPDRIVTISSIENDRGVYYFKDCGIRCNDKGIECLVERYVPPIPIYNRWEILDL